MTNGVSLGWRRLLKCKEKDSIAMKRWMHSEVLFQVVRKRWFQHIIFWCALFGLMVIPESSRMSLQTRITHAWIYLSTVAVAVYAHFFLWDRFLVRRRYALYAGGLVVTLVSVGYAEHRITAALFGEWGNLLASVMSLAFFLVFTSAIRLAKAGIRQQMEFQEIKAKQLHTELELLRAQINPHFLFNTLNNLYAMAQGEKDSATADAIARLSHLMRYVIYDSNVERIELNREIEQIRSYIELQKLRYSEDDDIRISMDVSGDTSRPVIAPMLLIPFVENAFKHGISLKQPSRILVRLEVTEGEIHFSIKNTIPRTRMETMNGEAALGLKNVRRRLELLYPGAHRLSAGESEGFFTVTLQLTIP